MPLKLNLPFTEKESVKQLGAFWDAENKVWFIPSHRDYNAFIKWINTEQINLIIKTPFYIGKNERRCWKCKKETTVVALYSTDFYVLDDSGEGNDMFYKQAQNLSLAG